MSTPTRYEFVFAPHAIAECLRTGARHQILDGLPHDKGEPVLTGAKIDDEGQLRLTFAVNCDGSDEKPPMLICKPLTVRTLEELP